jgi:hypothetical protein
MRHSRRKGFQVWKEKRRPETGGRPQFRQGNGA